MPLLPPRSQSGGQNCIGTERFLVHSSLYDAFVSTMRERISRLELGDVLSPSKVDKQVDVGAMISDRLFDELEELVAQAVKEGARCLVGGRRADKGVVGEGHYFEPTLLVDVCVPLFHFCTFSLPRLLSRRGACGADLLSLLSRRSTPSMAISQQEVFAPLMTVLKYDTLDEAVDIANGTRYGLGAAVFGRKQSECRYVMDRLECGMVCSNGASSFPSSSSPSLELALTLLVTLSQTLAVRPRSLDLTPRARR